MYASIITRPDISFAVGQVSRHFNNPCLRDWKAVKRILRYLKGTKKLGLRYRRILIPDLCIYSDADFAGDVSTRRSTTGYISMWNGGVITWASQLQRCVARSTTEAEYIAASNATQEISWLHSILTELGVEYSKPTILHIDNQSAIKLICSQDFHKRTKHIDVRYHYIREHYINGDICPSYICSNQQIADMFTKSLPKKPFETLRDEFMSSYVI
jgi:hypothetical protein